MYLAVDIGGTKTLVACFNNQGIVTEELKFPTPEEYPDFLDDLKDVVSNFKTKNFDAAAVAIPAMDIDREHEIAKKFPNLPWLNIKIDEDVGVIINAPVVMENDAKLAALSEAKLVKNQYSRVLYVTLSTGIGFAFVNDGIIDLNAGDAGGNTIELEREGKNVSWESRVSGRAIVKKYGKLAKEIDDHKTWDKIAVDIGDGLIQLVDVFRPEVVIIGGSVGNYFSRYAKSLNRELKKHSLPSLALPVLKEASRPDEAVIYGCYEFAKMVNTHG